MVVVGKLLDILKSKPSAVESIELFFAQHVEHLPTAGPLRSCLVTNSAIERGLKDKETRRKVQNLLKALENEFYITLQRGVNNSELSADFEIQASANFLTSNMLGLLVMGKVCSEKHVLKSINQLTLSVLKQGKYSDKSFTK